MKIRNLFLLILLSPIYLIHDAAIADIACYNQTPGKGDLSKNKQLIQQLRTSNEPAVLAWRARVKGLDSYNKFCQQQLHQQAPVIKSWSKVKEFLQTTVVKGTKPKGIVRECIQASLKREVSNDGYYCKNNTPVKFENMSSKTPCINAEVLSYMNFSINEAIDCVSPANGPIDSRYIMKKFNNETGFNFFLGYGGGVGIGQLTSDPVKEIAGWTSKVKGKTVFNKGNANYILRELMESKKNSCQAMKNTLEKDLDKSPPLPGDRDNYCHWVSLDKGFQRNLFYSIAYYRWIRDDVVKPHLQKKSRTLAADPRVLNALTLVAYGPGGLTQSKALIDRLRLQSNSNPDAVFKMIKQNSQYVKQTEEKMEELSPGMTGDACVK